MRHSSRRENEHDHQGRGVDGPRLKYTLRYPVFFQEDLSERSAGEDGGIEDALDLDPLVWLSMSRAGIVRSDEVECDGLEVL